MATDIDAKLLAAIRADCGVYRVFCDQMSLPNFGLELEPNQALLHGCEGPVVPNEYIVRLVPGHSLKEHFRVKITDIEPHVISTRIYDQHSSIAYWASNVDENMLAAIRLDI